MLSKLGGYGAFFAGISVLFFISFDRQPTAQDGILDAHAWNFNENRLALTGNWAFFQDELFDPAECKKEKALYRNFPALWNNVERDGMGFNTYYLKVIVPDSILTLSLEIPQIYSSCNVWVNGSLIAAAGKVGKSKETTVPQWIQKTVSFPNSRDTVEIVMQIANFHHYKGGATNPIMLGTPDNINSNLHWTLGSNIAEMILLLGTCGGFLFFYFRNSTKKVTLYFSLLCLTWGIRAAFSNQYPITLLFPNFNWAALVKIEYLTLYNGIIWAILFFNQLLKNISNQILTFVIVGMNVFFSIFTLLTPPLIFTHWIMVYLTIASIAIFYTTVIVIRALFLNQTGAWFLSLSLLLGALVFGYDIFAYENSKYNLVFLNIGYIVIFILTTLALLFNLGILKEKWSTNEVLTFNEMIRDSRTGDRT